MKKIILLFIFFSAFSAFAQNDSAKFWFGPSLGYGINSHQTDFQAFQDCPSCSPGYKNGSGGGLNFGVFALFPYKEKLKFNFALNYQDWKGDLTVDEIIGNKTIIENAFGLTNLEQVKVNHEVNTKISALSLEPSAVYSPFDNFNASLGLSFAYLMNAKFDQKEKILEPDNIVYLDTKQSARNVYTDRALPNKNAFQFRIMLGVGYDLKIGEQTFLEPNFKYYLPITNISSDIDYKVHSFVFGIALKIPYRNSIEDVKLPPIYYRDTVVKQVNGLVATRISTLDSNAKTNTKMENNKRISQDEITVHYLKEVPIICKANFDYAIYGITPGGIRQENPTVEIEETETEEDFPILPQVYFKAGDNNLSNTAMNILTSAQTANFKFDNLKWDALDLYKDMLNIIGARLAQNSGATITIIGCNSSLGADTGLALSQSRAEQTAKYFSDVWRINSKRINIKSQNLPDKPSNNMYPEGVEENQRVEILTNFPEATAPIHLSEIKKSSNPPSVEIPINISSDCGIKDVAYKIEQNGITLREGVTANNDKIVWNIEEKPIPAFETPVKITLFVTDTLDNKYSDSKEMTIKQNTIQKKRERIEGDKKIDKFSLIIFDYDKADLSANHADIIKKIKAKITPQSEIIIKAYTDKLGEAAHNKDLSMRRAQALYNALKIDNEKVTLSPLGSSEEIFDNNLPQGRAYSRTVRIEILTPVK